MEKTKLLEDGPAEYQPVQQGPQRLLGIQGLRAVAIISVMLFHVWKNTFTVGYLGVDIFFVISGYLMCMLMSRDIPLSWPKISNFYFRRLKRIVPTYLFFLLVSLTCALFFICPIDYAELLMESWKPLVFAANLVDESKGSYFAQNMKTFSFFLHLWSLSAEIQFYLFVPLLIYLIQRASLGVQISFVSVIGLISFLVQTNSRNDFEHMALPSRVWQFMYGFLAYYLSKNQPLNLQAYAHKFTNKEHNLSKFLLICDQLLNLILTLALLALVSVPVSSHKQINRLLVIVVVTLLIARSSSNCIISNKLMVLLGDISYSVYLVHWPLFEWYRYWNVEAFAYDKTYSLKAGVILIAISVFCGYLIEKLISLLKLSSWSKLVQLIVVLYLSIALAMASLQFYSMNLMPKLNRFATPKDLNKILTELEYIWKGRDSLQPLSRDLAMKYNSDFYRISPGIVARPLICKYNDYIPTKMDYTHFPRSGACTDVGNGTKNIVVIGNSHSNSYFPGIQFMFKNVYKYLTIVFLNGCVIDNTKIISNTKIICQGFQKGIIPMLQQWTMPIDVIIVGQAYHLPFNPQITRNDAVLSEMQYLYSQLSRLARELVLIPQVQLESGVIPHLPTLLRRIYYGASLEVFRTPIEYQLKNKVNIRKRIERVYCKNCLVVKWEGLWCKQEFNYCDTVDQINKISYFFDQYHMNIYGSLLVGKYLRQTYDEWNENNQKQVLDDIDIQTSPKFTNQSVDS